jgi:hypothetical protein
MWFADSAAPGRARGRHCSDFVGSCQVENVLLVGAERADEFADAIRLSRHGYGITVVNPRETTAARKFQRQGGRFIAARIEDLAGSGVYFDTICENYPYPLRRYSGPAKRFALARLKRLAPQGRWIVVTESSRFATALKALADFDSDIARNFTLRSSVVSPRQAPPSTYPPVNTRFRLIFQRRG